MSQEQFFDSGMVRINYLETGRPNGDPVVMLHGGAWSWLEYASLIPAISDEYHVYAPDLRGNGKSGWTPGQYRLDDFTGDIAAFLRPLSDPATLIGHSIGGVVALMTAAKVPEKVKAVVVEDAPLNLKNYEAIIDLSRGMFRTWLDLKKSARSKEELSLALAREYGNHPGATSQWMIYFAECLLQLDPTFFNPLLYDFEGFVRGYEYKAILGSIQIPLMFIRGEAKYGAVMSDEETGWIHLNCPSASCVVIPGAGHLLHLQDIGAAPVKKTIMDFLQKGRG